MLRLAGLGAVLAELVNIYDNHPCIPINNVIEDNKFCHSHSLNASQPTARFINQVRETPSLEPVFQFNHARNDPFTKTGSGQAQEKLREKARDSSTRMRALCSAG
jgi:hypothetical protein